MASESLFLSYTRYIFKRWVGFQEAITEGMGGDYSLEKELWIGDEVENYFKRYDNVQPDEIEDYLGTMIENEFSTSFEDGSLQEVSSILCTAYPLSLTNPDAEIFQEMRKVISMKSSQESSELKLHKQNEQAACEKMEQLTISENTEDDGWTVVQKKNKNK